MRNNSSASYGGDSGPGSGGDPIPVLSSVIQSSTIDWDAVAQSLGITPGNNSDPTADDNSVNQGRAWEVLVLPTSAWQSQMPDQTGCFRTCEAITGTEPPLSHAILIDQLGNNALKGEEAMMQMLLVNKQPVIVGVNYKPGSPNRDGITDHFVVLAGYGMDNNSQFYFRFYDPGTSSFSNGTDPLNRFYILDPFIVGIRWTNPNRGYIVSQVRLP